MPTVECQATKGVQNMACPLSADFVFFCGDGAPIEMIFRHLAGDKDVNLICKTGKNHDKVSNAAKIEYAATMSMNNFDQGSMKKTMEVLVVACTKMKCH